MASRTFSEIFRLYDAPNPDESLIEGVVESLRDIYEGLFTFEDISRIGVNGDLVLSHLKIAVNGSWQHFSMPTDEVGLAKLLGINDTHEVDVFLHHISEFPHWRLKVDFYGETTSIDTHQYIRHIRVSTKRNGDEVQPIQIAGQSSTKQQLLSPITNESTPANSALAWRFPTTTVVCDRVVQVSKVEGGGTLSDVGSPLPQ